MELNGTKERTNSDCAAIEDMQNEAEDKTFKMEDVLNEIGGCGMYQLRMTLIIICGNLVVVMCMLDSVFTSAIRPWRCHSDLATGNQTTQTSVISNLSSTPMANPYDSDCQDFDNTSYQCDIEFDLRWKTVVNEWNLVCHKRWIPSMMTTIQMVGVLIGNLVSGQIGDWFGRKRPYYGALVITIAGNLLLAFSVSPEMFCFSLFLMGCGVRSMLTTEYTIVCEFLDDKWRSVFANFPTWPIEGCICVLIWWILQDWRHIHLAIALIGAPFLLTWWFVPESVRWCVTRNRITDAEQVLRAIAKTNKRRFPINFHPEQWQHMGQQTGENKKFSMLDIVKDRTLLKYTLALMVLWFSLGCASYAIAFGVQALSGDLFLNFLLLCLVQLPAYSIAMYLSNRIGRRWTILLCFSLTTVFALVVCILHFKGIKNGGLTNGFAMTASLTISTAWGPTVLMTVELFPTVVRNISYGFQNVVSRIGVVIAPQIVLLDRERPGWLYLVATILSVCACGAAFCLPETRGRNLEDTLERKSEKNDTPNIQTCIEIKQ